jgi:hypothetical protein
VIDIDKGDDQQHGNEKKIDASGQCRPVFQENRQGSEAGDQFDQRIANGDMNLTAAAASSQQDIAEDGYVVVKANPITALGTGGRWMDDGFTLRDAVNADIEKTADAGPKDETKISN